MKKNKSHHRFSFFPIRWMLVFYDYLIYLFVAFFGLLLYYTRNLSDFAALDGDKWLQILFHYLIGAFICSVSRFFWKVYGQIWRYGGVQSYIRLMLADTCFLAVYYLIARFVPFLDHIGALSVIFIVFSNTLVCLAVRMLYRLAYKRLNRRTRFGAFIVKTVNIFGRCDWSEGSGDPVDKIRIAIVGAGGVGIGLAEELLNTPNSAYYPACFVDVDKEKLGREIYGKEVLLESDNTPELLKEYNVQEVVLALPPSVSGDERKTLYDKYKTAGFKIKSYDYPTMQTSKKGRRTLRDFDIDELLFRKEQDLITDEAVAYYKNKIILVTGGGGSIGSEIARQLAKMEPKQLILLDIYENGVYDVQQELKMHYGDKLDLRIEICSITNRPALERVFKAYEPNIVVMAAAHKHVPLMEHNIIEAVENNVFGTLNTVELSEKYHADRVHMVSTDKAVNPTNVMGATKRICEMIVFSHAHLKQHTTFSATRFGNVLGSAGSVIPLFKRQIANGGPVTLTDKRIIRYFMTIPEASQLVLHSATIAKNGELMVLDMGQPIRIYDLAIQMIELAGFKPDKDIDIIETGLRPGEKLYEELLVKDETLTKTGNEQIFIEKDQPISIDDLNTKLNMLQQAMSTGIDEYTKSVIKEVVPTFVDNPIVNQREDARLKQRE